MSLKAGMGWLALAMLASFPADAAPEGRELQLDVIVNGRPAGLIGAFTQRPDGSLAAAPQELREVGIDPGSREGFVDLKQVPGLTYSFDEVSQSVRFEATEGARAARRIDLGQEPREDAPEPKTGYGGVFNYTLFAGADREMKADSKTMQRLSGAFDTRVFTPFGNLGQSFVGNLSSDRLRGAVRLDTVWTYVSSDRVLTYRAGDTNSGGLSWTRPVRLGGFQIQRNFALRPDLVTMPLPALSGSAAVPSTLDVYSQNAKIYSQSIPSGPFELDNLPAVTGAGTARVVLRDAIGRETVTTLPFYVSAQLLRKGLYDYSAEIGYPRLFYGVESNDYSHMPFGSGSLRYGWNDRLTLESHAEGGRGLQNGGMGAVLNWGSFGIASLAAAGSRSDRGIGAQASVSFEASYAGISLYARSQRSFGEYDDIASVTAPRLNPDSLQGWLSSGARPPKSLDQLTVGLPLFNQSAINLTYTQLKTAQGGGNRILGISHSRSIFKNCTIFATAFKALDHRKSFGVFAGLSVQLGHDVTTTASLARGPSGVSGAADLVKSETLEDGAYGWRVHAGKGDVADRSAAASYRASFGRFEGAVQQFGNARRATAQVEGSVASAGGGVFVANRIDDAFAVVDAGAPGIEVQAENRTIGKTNSQGMLLVPYLNSYQANRISIQPGALPVDADVPHTKQVVMPGNRSGVVVSFGVSDRLQAALVTLNDAKGRPLEAGLQGRLDGTGTPFVVGYDGQAYIRDLGAQNHVKVALADGSSCEARFPYAKQPGQQVRINSVICR